MASKTPRIDTLSAMQNIIINGNFDFFHRGLSVSVSSGNSGAFLADRFSFSNDVSSPITISRASSVPTVAQSGFRSVNSLLATNNGAPNPLSSGNACGISYRIEGSDYATIHGSKKVRLQFWVRSSITGIYSVAFTSPSGTRSSVYEYTINAANTWEKNAVDVVTDLEGQAGYNFDNAEGLGIFFSLGSLNRDAPTAGVWTNNTPKFLSKATATRSSGASTSWNQQANATFVMSQLMLMPLDLSAAALLNVDAIFARAGRTIQQELAMCQRYYWNSAYALTGGTLAVGGGFFNIPYPVPLRTTPSTAFVSHTAATPSPGPVTSDTNVGSKLAGQYTVQAQNTSGSTLSFNTTVNAEL
jgi:hypothetical protein